MSSQPWCIDLQPPLNRTPKRMRKSSVCCVCLRDRRSIFGQSVPYTAFSSLYFLIATYRFPHTRSPESIGAFKQPAEFPFVYKLKLSVGHKYQSNFSTKLWVWMWQRNALLATWKCPTKSQITFFAIIQDLTRGSFVLSLHTLSLVSSETNTLSWRQL